MNGKNIRDQNSEQSKTLHAFSRALGREAHVLTQQPDLFWQQMYNRLQWEGNEVKQTLAPELDWRSTSVNQPWLKLLTHYRESGSILRVMQGHDGQINSIEFSHDGKFLLSAGDDHSIKIWDVSSGLLVRTFRGHSGEVLSCAFSLDGSRILSTSKDKTMKVWETASGKVLDTFEDDASDCSFSPDGKYFLSIGKDNKGRLREGHNGQNTREFDSPQKTIRKCVFSPDGRFIITVNDLICLWDYATGQFLRSLGKSNIWQEDCAVSPDGRLIAVACTSGLDIWNVDTGKNAYLFYCHGYEIIVSACAFTPDGLYIISGGYDKTLRIWETASGQEIGVLEGHTNCVESCSISQDGRYLASGDWNGTIILWDLKAGFSLPTKKGQVNAITDCAYSPDGKLLASASSDRTIIIRDSSSDEVLTLLDKHAERVTACSFSPDGQYLASSSDDRSLRVWDLASGEQINVQGTYDEPVSSCAFSPDGRFIVTTCEDKALYLWEVENDPREGIYYLQEHSGRVLSCAFSPEGQHILSASEDKTVCMWDISTNKMTRTFSGHEDEVSDCVFSPDGFLVASMSYDKTVRVWEAGTGILCLVVRDHAGEALFSPDGQFLFICGASKLAIWNMQTAELVHLYHLPVGAFTFCLHPNQERIAFGMGNGAVYQYRLYGITHGPIIVTAVKRENGLTVQCPHCLNTFPVSSGDLDCVITCHDETCKAHLKLNRFSLNRPESLKIFRYIYEPVRE